MNAGDAGALPGKLASRAGWPGSLATCPSARYPWSGAPALSWSGSGGEGRTEWPEGRDCVPAFRSLVLFAVAGSGVAAHLVVAVGQVVVHGLLGGGVHGAGL